MYEEKINRFFSIKLQMTKKVKNIKSRFRLRTYLLSSLITISVIYFRNPFYTLTNTDSQWLYFLYKRKFESGNNRLSSFLESNDVFSYIELSDLVDQSSCQ